MASITLIDALHYNSTSETFLYRKKLDNENSMK